MENRTQLEFLVVLFSDKRRYRIPTDIIADSYANYYARNEVAFSEAYSKEYNEVICDKNLLIEWAKNNMNWSEVENDAFLLPYCDSDNPDYDEEWTNAAMYTIKEGEDVPA